jgi:hypothetical protein
VASRGPQSLSPTFCLTSCPLSLSSSLSPASHFPYMRASTEHPLSLSSSLSPASHFPHTRSSSLSPASHFPHTRASTEQESGRFQLRSLIFVRLRPIINVCAPIIDDAAAGSDRLSFQYLGILLWISHVPARRDRRMIKLICRMPSCMDYVLAKFVCGLYRLCTLVSMHYEVCMNYALFYFSELWSLYGLCTRLFIWTMHFVVCIYVQIHVLYAILWAKYVNMFIS